MVDSEPSNLRYAGGVIMIDSLDENIWVQCEDCDKFVHPQYDIDGPSWLDFQSESKCDGPLGLYRHSYDCFNTKPAICLVQNGEKFFLKTAVEEFGLSCEEDTFNGIKEFQKCMSEYAAKKLLNKYKTELERWSAG